MNGRAPKNPPEDPASGPEPAGQSAWNEQALSGPLRIALIYTAISILWILASDRAISLIGDYRDLALWLGSTKRWLFVAVTAALIYALTRRMITDMSRMHGHAISLQTERLKALRMLDAITSSSEEIVYAKDCDGRYTMCNAAAARCIGRTPDEVIGRTDRDLFPLADADLLAATDRQVILSGQPHTIEETLEPAGLPRTVLMTKGPLYDEEGRMTGLFGVGRDITERTQAETRLLQLNRSLRMLSACNMTLIYAEDEGELLKEICRLIVTTGGYRMAWVGYVDDKPEKLVRTVAQWGAGTRYLEEIHVTWDDSDYGRGPTGASIRTGRPCIYQNIDTDPFMTPWRAAAHREGYRAGIGLPLLSADGVFGALTVHAGEADAFSEEEIHLLEELARDLAFGIATIRERRDHAEAERRLAFLDMHDRLTGLPNRLLVADRFKMAQAYAGARRHLVALMVIDIDNFKLVNESIGHQGADQLLQAVANRLSTATRETDTLARHGGDEFVLLVADAPNLDKVIGIAQATLGLFAGAFEMATQRLSCSASIGISVCPADGEDFEGLLKKASAAMHHAKAMGRNVYCFFDPAMTAGNEEAISLHQGLRQALDRGEFQLYYQPQIDMRNDRIIGAEALIRWAHPDLGLVPPGRFIPLAENNGTIVAIGRWVIREACRQMAAWRRAGLPDLVVAVNLSALQFTRGLEQIVLDALAENALPPASLEFELTESILIKDADAVLAFVQTLKSIGIKLSIDDFGTGYSSLAYLKRFKPDRLKIDQSFVRDLADNPDSAAIVQTIIQMAGNLNIEPLAEGVEDEATAAWLRRHGCPHAQGYHFGRPMPAEDFAALLKGRQ